MRTHVEFVSTAFPPYPAEEYEVNPGIFGRRLAEFLAAQLPQYGFNVEDELNREDWGWGIALKNEPFPVWIGCANYEELENGFLCFVEPSTPFVRRWFRKIDTRHVVERVAQAIESILQQSGKVQRMRWWDEGEVP